MTMLQTIVIHYLVGLSQDHARYRSLLLLQILENCMLSTHQTYLEFWCLAYYI